MLVPSGVVTALRAGPGRGHQAAGQHHRAASGFGAFPGIGMFRCWPACCPQLAERRVQRIEAGGGHDLVHP